jgi:hypothetical protein
MHALQMFRNCRLARMSDGHYCFVRDLGPVKGGKGMKHHEVVLDLNRRGMVTFVRGLFAKAREVEPSQPPAIASTAIRTTEPYSLETSIKVTPDAAESVTLAKKRARASR